MQNDADERSLGDRLQYLEAKDAIASAIRNVARALDRLDRALLINQFHADAQIDYGAIYRGGIDGFAEIALQFQGSMRDTQHLVGNIQIEVVDELTATAESYVYAHHTLQTEEGLIELVVGGRYLDTFKCREGTWRIVARTEVLDWGRRLRIEETWFEENRELPKGRRDRTDLSYSLFAR